MAQHGGDFDVEGMKAHHHLLASAITLKEAIAKPEEANVSGGDST